MDQLRKVGRIDVSLLIPNLSLSVVSKRHTELKNLGGKKCIYTLQF